MPAYTYTCPTCGHTLMRVTWTATACACAGTQPTDGGEGMNRLTKLRDALKEKQDVVSGHRCDDGRPRPNDTYLAWRHDLLHGLLTDDTITALLDVAEAVEMYRDRFVCEGQDCECCPAKSTCRFRSFGVRAAIDSIAPPLKERT